MTCIGFMKSPGLNNTDPVTGAFVLFFFFRILDEVCRTTAPVTGSTYTSLVVVYVVRPGHILYYDNEYE